MRIGSSIFLIAIGAILAWAITPGLIPNVDLTLVGGHVEADDARERRLAAGEGDEGVAHGGMRGRGADELPDLRLKKDADLHRTRGGSGGCPASRADRVSECCAASRPRA